MDDGEVVAAIAAGDPGGLAAAYDTYAAPVYGYCRWMLRDPGLAAEVLRDTFCAAAAKLGVRDAGHLRAWLYANARDDCYRRLRTAEPGFDEGTGEDAWPAGAGARPDGRPDVRTEQAVVRRVLREILADLRPEEHEVIELTVRHGLDESELAAVFEVSWSRAHALASQAREHLEKALDALLIARTGRQSCPELGALLAGWDGKLTVETGKLAARHIEHCPVCASRRHGSLRPEVLARLLPLPALPAGLREAVLELAATRSVSRVSKAALAETSVDLLAPVGSGRLGGFFSWDRIRANPGTVTAATAMTLWAVAALAATLVALSGLHATGVLADQAHNAAAASSTPVSSSAPPLSVSPDRSRSSRPSTRATPAVLPTFAPTPTAGPSKSATPKPSASAAASTSPSASPSGSDTSTPTPKPTRVHTPTPTPTPTPTSTPTPTDTPTPTPT
jgi:RNA polymerase sigma factor (sigma-70 family)